MRKIISLLLITIMFCGCATTYKPIRPSDLTYKNIEIGEKISYAYKFDVLDKTGNRKYAKKENKHNIDIVSLQTY